VTETLSEAEVARVRGAFEGLLEGDPGQWIALIDEDIGWDISAHPLPDVPDRGRGRDEAIGVWATYVSGWNDYRAEVTELVPAGEEIVIVVHEQVRMRETDVPLERELAYVWTIRDDRIVRLRVFKTGDEAKRAVGI
jgi:ketosteroid isomerase-like protein